MKTPIQECIELLQKELDTSHITLVLKVYKLIEKEKQMIIDVYKYGLNDEFSDYLDGTKQAEEYYNETFKLIEE